MKETENEKEKEKYNRLDSSGLDVDARAIREGTHADTRVGAHSQGSSTKVVRVLESNFRPFRARYARFAAP